MITKQHTLLLGAHMSSAGGFDKAIERGTSIDCTCIQIFTKSNRQWADKPISPEQAEAFLAAWRNSPIKQVVAHASYLINLGSTTPKTVAYSQQALKNELLRCDILHIPYLVLHPGSSSQGNEQACLAQITQILNQVLEEYDGNTMLLLETMAGQGSSVGHRFEQIATMLHGIKNKRRVGVCVDTCHLFSAGYDLRTPQTYHAVWQQFDALIGLEKLKVIHINDSKKELGSRVDRHEHIGMGKLGKEAFALLFNDERFFDIPKILETPKSDTQPLADDAMNMQIIKELILPTTKKILQLA